MIARLAPISRWTERIKGAAMVGALCLAAASGYAFAIGPTIDVNRTFAGSVNIVGATLGSASSVYTVPAGKQLTLTGCDRRCYWRNRRTRSNVHCE